MFAHPYEISAFTIIIKMLLLYFEQSSVKRLHLLVMKHCSGSDLTAAGLHAIGHQWKPACKSAPDNVQSCSSTTTF